ncbi:MAG TPA: PAN domain-containing protein [Silvibacterium sp.]|nr:PAN domain-containing protein [Silvibacterium sp.]
MARLFWLLLAIASSCAGQGFEQARNLFGTDIREFDLPRPEPMLCYESCLKEQACRAYTYRYPRGAAGAGKTARCSLKSSVASGNFDPDSISGVVFKSRSAPRSAEVPFVSAVMPSEGPAWGGNAVTIRGSGFAKAVRVTFGRDHEAESFTVVSDNEIRAVPAPYPNPWNIPLGGYLAEVAVFDRPGPFTKEEWRGTFLYRPPEGVRFVEHTELVGMDFRDFDVRNAGECLSACVRESSCKALSYKVELHALGGGPGPQPTPHPAHCWLKSGVPAESREAALYWSAVLEGETK